MKKSWIFLVCLVVSSSLFAEMKILAFAGSTRKDSYNKQLIDLAAAAARQMGATVTVIDLKDYPMPFYDGDLEKNQGMPANAKKFRALMIGSDAVMISSPEYNASIPAVLKNALDWASRGENGGGSSEAFKGKKFALMSASPGRRGGARGLVHLREIIEDVGGEVTPLQVTVPQAYNVFKEGNANAPLKEELRQEVQQLMNLPSH